ncbi:ABC transporter permease [Sulfolobus sp. D5]|nr:ABC transporter permease [Sulfolobus sp. D5]
MNLIDTLWLAYKGLMSRKALAFISILAIFIGITSVSYIQAFSTGFENSILSIFFSLNPENIFVTPNTLPYVSPTDVALMQTLPGVRGVYPVIIFPGIVDIAGKVTDVTIIGVNNISALIGNVGLENGTFYPAYAVGPYAVIGNGIANPVSNIYLQPGQTLVVKLPNGNSVPLTVYGIMKPAETVIGSTANAIFIPLSEAKALFNTPGYSLVVIQSDGLNGINSIVNYLKDIYGNGYTIQTVEQIISEIRVALVGFSFFLIIITSVSLLVGSVGILGITLARVYQRIREIGIMKTLSLTTRDILLIILFEAIIVGLIGGVAGVIVTFLVVTGVNLNGISINLGPASSSGLTVFLSLSAQDVLISLGIAILASVIAGIYPALKASRLTVIEAIRRD